MVSTLSHVNFMPSENPIITIFMKTILVPTDFSATAKAAALYAFNVAKQFQASKIVLYHAFQTPPVITEPSMPAVSYMDVDTLRHISETGMKHFKASLEAVCPSGIQIVEIVEFAVLSEEIDKVCERAGAELIIMGITGTSKIEEVLIGSTALSVMKNTKVPMIIVPADNANTAIKNVMMVTDLKNVVETTPTESIKKVLEATNAQLHVVNIYEEDNDITGEKNYQQELLQSLLQSFNPEFHFLYNHHFMEGVNDFVKNNQIDLIIAIPKKHGFFANFFKEGHTKKLAFHSHVPLMYVHNEEL